MKALFDDNTERGRGYACFRLTEVLGLDASGTDWTFSLLCASEQQYLGKEGWQESEEFHEPDIATASNGELVLYVGPQVVDRLLVNENYRIFVKTKGSGTQYATLAITSISQSLGVGAGNVSIYTAPPKPAAPVAPVAPPVPEAELEPTPGVKPEAADEPAAVETIPSPASATAQTSSPAGSSKGLLMAGVALCLLLAAGGGWWFMNSQKDAAPPADVAKADPPTAPTPPVAATPAVPATPPAAAPVVQSAREQARAFFAGQPTPQAAMELAGKLGSGTEEEQDALYRLYYYAAEEKLPAAYAPLAKAADPTQPQWGSIPKDAVEAWTLYQRLAATDPAAQQAMDNLKKWLDAQTANGNKEAEAWNAAITALPAQRQ